MSQAVIFLIKLYQKFLSPAFTGSCRFYPSCSHYGIEAFKVHGFFKGISLTTFRILRCNPFFEGGYDPVPSQEKESLNLKKHLH